MPHAQPRPNSRPRKSRPISKRRPSAANLLGLLPLAGLAEDARERGPSPLLVPGGGSGASPAAVGLRVRAPSDRPYPIALRAAAERGPSRAPTYLGLHVAARQPEPTTPAPTLHPPAQEPHAAPPSSGWSPPIQLCLRISNPAANAGPNQPAVPRLTARPPSARRRASRRPRHKSTASTTRPAAPDQPCRRRPHALALPHEALRGDAGRTRGHRSSRRRTSGPVSPEAPVVCPSRPAIAR